MERFGRLMIKNHFTLRAAYFEKERFFTPETDDAFYDNFDDY